jgi:hypothetical protein
MVATIIAVWLVCGLVGSVLIAFWWTDELPLTTDELPGLVFCVVLGPVNLGIGLMFLASIALKRVIRALLPPGRRVIFRQWGR